MAWLGSKPKKLRLEILDISGQPAASLATDGNYFYLLSHIESRFYKKHSTDDSLEKLISIPVRSSDILSFLSGQAPIYNYDRALLKKTESEDGYVLILRKNWQGIVEKIYLDQNKEVYKVEIFNGKNSPLYRALLHGTQNINGYRIPLRLEISTDDGFYLKLDIDKYWADVYVSPSMFILPPPEG